MDRPLVSALTAPARVAGTVRAGDWWGFKLTPLLGVFYLTTLQTQASLSDRWPRLLVLLAALVVGAAFVSLLNDLCDVRDDAVAGKVNRLAGRNQTVVAVAMLGCLAAGLGIGVAMPPDPLALVAYACAWIAFALYSSPPVRLKTRGGWGLLADAAGSSLFPAVLAARLAGSQEGPWLALVALWSLAFGLRGIAFHQLSDEAADRRAGVPTFVVRHGPHATIRFVNFLVVPLEMLALAGLFILSGSAAPFVGLALYVVLMKLREIYFWETPTFIVPQSRGVMIGHGFYDFILPVLVLAALSVNNAWNLPFLILHLAIFADMTLRFLKDIKAIWLCRREVMIERKARLQG